MTPLADVRTRDGRGGFIFPVRFVRDLRERLRGDDVADARAKARRRPLVSRLARGLEPRARRAFLDAARAVRGAVDLDGLERALRTGELTAVEAELALGRLAPELMARFRPVVSRGLGLGIEAAREALPAGVDVSFTATNPESVLWAERRAAALVTEVDQSTRSAVRALVRASQAEGREVRWLARELREVVALREDQVAAVERFRQRLVLQELPADRVAARTERYAAAQLRLRANTIARTETIAATAAGQDRLWEAAADSGAIDRDRARREWLVTPDDVLDAEVCEPMDGQRVLIGEPFVTGTGERVMQPPAHPNCRCAFGLVFE